VLITKLYGTHGLLCQDGDSFLRTEMVNWEQYS